MDKKGRLGIEKYLLSFVIFGAFLLVGVLMISDMNNTYGLSMSTEDFNDSYDTIDSMYNISQDQAENVLGSSLEGDDAVDSSISGGYSAVRLVRNTFSLVGDIIQDIFQTLPIPAPLLAMALTAVSIIVIFGILFIFLRYRD